MRLYAKHSVVPVFVSVAYLKEQKALTEEESLTPVGHMLSQLPVDVVIGKMLIMASVFQVSKHCQKFAVALFLRATQFFF